MNTSKQMSETIRLGLLLAITGGFMDAYSYLYRGHVFANAQTGNILLFGVNLAERHYDTAMHYFFPVIAFTLGIILSEVIRHLIGSLTGLHWRQFAVLFEAVILFAVAFIPFKYNLLANSLTSFACGIQVESFRKIHGNSIATTMCIGNLRSGTQNLCEYFFQKDRSCLKKCVLYYGIILFFIIGAIIGSHMIELLNEKAILIGSALLLFTFCLMFGKHTDIAKETS